MPFYHFHRRTPDGLILDEEGQELPDLSSARQEALDCPRHHARAGLEGRGTGWLPIEIADADGAVLLVFPLIETIFCCVQSIRRPTRQRSCIRPTRHS